MIWPWTSRNPFGFCGSNSSSFFLQSATDIAQIRELQVQLEEAQKERHGLQEKVGPPSGPEILANVALIPWVLGGVKDPGVIQSSVDGEDPFGWICVLGINFIVIVLSHNEMLQPWSVVRSGNGRNKKLFPLYGHSCR